MILLASWGLLAIGASSLAALIAGIVVRDLGVQGLHVSNQSTIYALIPEARSRVTPRTWSPRSSAVLSLCLWLLS